MQHRSLNLFSLHSPPSRKDARGTPGHLAVVCLRIPRWYDPLGGGTCVDVCLKDKEIEC